MSEITRDPNLTGQIAYFSMEFAYVQALKTYSGGLGFLAGSHMRSAWTLKQPIVAIGILWKYGYYEQTRNADQTMDVLFLERHYSFLQPTNLRFQITVNQSPVWVTAYFLPPTTFGTVPTYFLSTDLPENDYLAQTISHRLYDANPEARIAASILLGIGGAKLLDLLLLTPDIYHLNESHPLPVAFHLYKQWGSLAAVQQRLVFTTHTPEEAGNPKTDCRLLMRMGFFDELSLEEVRHITGIQEDSFNWALGALRLSGIANAVSKRHQQVCQQLWQGYADLCPILSITNAQNRQFWADPALADALASEDDFALVTQKKRLKHALFEAVVDQTGALFDADVFTLVWACRFAGYKRADLLLRDPARLERLLTNPRYPIQLIWAGKPFPSDQASIASFNQLVQVARQHTNCAVLVNYGIDLSRQLKGGADLWLNTPRLTREASGTSGMSAAMNGAINGSTNDGWIPEFARNGLNSFILPDTDLTKPLPEQDEYDADNLFTLLETIILPLFYDRHQAWVQIMKASMRDVSPYFDSHRLALEYAEKLYGASSVY